MQAFQITQFGLENLKQARLPDPTPGPGQVVVKIRAVSLNYRDLLMVRGHYNPKLHLPRIPVSDGAGEVVAIGSGVTHFRVGDRVAGLFQQNWQEGQPSAEKSRGALADDVEGMLAEFVLLPESGLISIPAHLSYEEAATLPCAALTAWNALNHAARLSAGDTVVIQGTGGVSIFALQFAKLMGLRVLGTSSSDAKLARAKELGLDEGVNYKQRPNWSEWVKEQTGGHGADLILEVGGSGTLGESMKSVRIGGTIVQIGMLSGVENVISVIPILMRQMHIVGVFVGSRSMFQAMNRAIALHQLKPAVDKVFPFGETLAAYRYLENAQHFGKVVISLAGA